MSVKTPEWLKKLLANKPLNRALRGLAWLALDWFISKKLKGNSNERK